MNHKTILVTGASRGIGKAIALTYARNGWDVVITCLRREEELKKTQREIEALGVSCLAWMGDAGDFESCSRLFDAIRERFGSLDVLRATFSTSIVGAIMDSIMVIGVLVMMILYGGWLTWVVIAFTALYVLLRLLTYDYYRQLSEESLVSLGKGDYRLQFIALFLDRVWSAMSWP